MGDAKAVRQGDWKLVRQKPGFAYELFNLATDVSEKNNLAAQNPDVVARLRGILESARTPHPAFPVA